MKLINLAEKFQLCITSRLREVCEANLGNFSRKFPLNRCYVGRLQVDRPKGQFGFWRQL